MPIKTLPKGHPSLLGAGFRYTPAVHTDLAKTFARVREQQEKQQPHDHAIRARPSSTRFST